MNPFKHKQLKEFTIIDCETYIGRYPYGEHITEVKRHHRNLIKSQHNSSNKNNEPIKPKKSEELHTETKIDSHCVESTKKEKNTSTNIVQTILSWIGGIVVAVVVGIIIITILDTILPGDWWAWINKYKTAIIVPVVMLGKWLQKKLNW